MTSDSSGVEGNIDNEAVETDRMFAAQNSSLPQKHILLAGIAPHHSKYTRTIYPH